MSINARWKTLAAYAAITLALAACGDDKDGGGNGNGNGGSTSGDGGANGNGNTGDNGNTGSSNGGNTGDGGDDNNGDDEPLGPGVVGKACTEATEVTDCGPSGECRDPLRGGTYANQTLGSGTGPTGGYCTASCQADADCGEGGVCFGSGRRGGECRKSCEAAADCERDNYECAQLNNPPLVDDETGMEVAVPKTCQPMREPVSFTNEVGTACADDTACNGGTCRMGGDWPGGYCSGSCNSDSDCGAEGFCLLRPYGSGGSCYETCSVDTDCKRDAMNYGCVEATGGAKVCAFKLDPLPAGIVGKACTADTDCANGECEDGFGQIPAPGGYCTADDCEEDAQCGPGAVCLRSGRGTSCFLSCTADANCRSGYACTEQGATDKRATVCYPVATMGDAGP